MASEVDREEYYSPPHRNLNQQRRNNTTLPNATTVYEHSSKPNRCQNIIHQNIIAKRRHPNTKQYVDVGDVLFDFLYSHVILDLLFYRLTADIFTTELPYHPRVDVDGNDNSSNHYGVSCELGVEKRYDCRCVQQSKNNHSKDVCLELLRLDPPFVRNKAQENTKD